MKTPAPTKSNDRPTYVALESIFRAIDDLTRPTGTAEVFGGPLVGPRNTYRYETQDELLEVTDDLIGAAFVLAQTYISRDKNNWTPAMTNIHHVANYWKHRDEWGPRWAVPNRKTLVAKTVAAVTALGAKPPVYPGQVRDLAKACFKTVFDLDQLWAAINP